MTTEELLLQARDRLEFSAKNEHPMHTEMPYFSNYII